MECIADYVYPVIDTLPAAQPQKRPEPGAAAPPSDRDAGGLRLRVLALILHENLSVAETAAALAIPERRVREACAGAIKRIRERVCDEP